MDAFLYPWNVLGVPPHATESEVKKAYARLLRLNRPDENPQGFQALVHARDVALAHARRIAAQRRREGPAESAPDRPAAGEPPPPPLPESQVPQSKESESPPPVPQPQATILQFPVKRRDADRLPEAASPPEPSPLSDPAADTPAPPPPAAEVEILPQQEPSSAAPAVQAEVLPEKKPLADGPVPAPERAHSPEPAIRHAAPLPRNLVPPPPPVSPAPGLEINPEQIVAAIVASLGPNPGEAQLRESAKAAARLQDFSLTARRKAEPWLLTATLPRLPEISGRLMMGRGGLSGRIASAFNKTEPERDMCARRQLELILLLNEDYGWTASDRRVYELAGREAGTAAVLYLNAFERAAKVARAAKAKGRSSVPLMDERDARAVFGSEYGTYVPLLAKLRTGTRMPLRWNTAVSILLPIYLISWGLYRPLALWIAAVFAAEAYSEWDLPQASEWAVVHYAGWLPLAVLHLYGGAYAYRWTIGRAMSRIARADRDRLFDPAKRLAFLSRSAGQSRKVQFTSGGWRIWWLIGWLAFIALNAIFAGSHR